MLCLQPRPAFRLLLIVICFWLLPQDLFRTFCGAMALGASLICNRIPGLTAKQRQFCQRTPDVMVAIGNGARLGITECQEQFKNHRWNCTGPANQTIFGHVVLVGSREAAFQYAVWSAGVTYAISQACSRGTISSCRCDTSKRGKENSAVAPQETSSSSSVAAVATASLSSPGWKWGGCSADVNFGASHAEKFVDARELENDGRSLMNLHNNRAGRKAVKHNLVTECKCHGVSGSCTLKTCWQTLPPFRRIGEHLLLKYYDAKAVVARETPSGNDSKPRRRLMLQLRKSRRPHRKPRITDLVFLQPSPNYCEANPSTGSLGISGRKCNRTSGGAGGCDLLCCGRGYNTHQFTRVFQCRCKFHWCCHVTCRTCSERTEEHTCK